MATGAVFTFAAPVATPAGPLTALRLREPSVRDFLDLGALALRPKPKQARDTAAIDVPGRGLDYLRRLADVDGPTLEAALDALPLAEGLRLRAILGGLVPDARREDIEGAADAVALDWQQATLATVDVMPLSRLADTCRRLSNHAERLRRRRRS